MENLVRFDKFVFNSETGELTHRDEQDKVIVSRLQPQPAKLLKLLIDHFPEVVSREQIRDAIWPDVQVDFDGSMHFCIRQIRAALNDPAGKPKFIENIPRRGYRWIAEIKGKEKIKRPVNPFLKRAWQLGLMAVGILVCSLYFISIKSKDMKSDGASPEKLRLAIMPFQPADTTNAFTGNDIALQLLEKLTNKYRREMDVLGPATTLHFEPDALRRSIADQEIDFLINGRFSTPDLKSRMLVEIIRATDGAHIWVRSYIAPINQDSLLVDIGQGVQEWVIGQDGE